MPISSEPESGADEPAPPDAPRPRGETDPPATTPPKPADTRHASSERRPQRAPSMRPSRPARYCPRECRGTRARCVRMSPPAHPGGQQTSERALSGGKDATHSTDECFQSQAVAGDHFHAPTLT